MRDLFSSSETTHKESKSNLSLVRITGGILVILWGQIPKTGLMVAAIIFLNTGVFPLIAATLGLIRLM